MDWDTTKNLYIEGDNLDALKLLKETYAGKIKLIYIDPPYNTGNDFIYDDNFVMSDEEYESGETTDDGRLVANLESNGRFHSDWCSMIYPRLLLAKDLLSADGVIFISIDDNELSNMLSICDSIFSSKMRVGIFKWNKTSKAPTLSKFIRNKYEYVLCYRKPELLGLRGPDSYNTAAPLFNSGNKHSRLTVPAESIDCAFPDGVYPAGRYGDDEKYVILHNDLIVENGVNHNPLDITGRFKWAQETMNVRVLNGQRFQFKKPNFQTMYYYLDSDNKYIAPSDVLNKDECSVLRNDEAYSELKEMFGFVPFDYTKPVSLIKYLIRMHPSKDIIALDFFSGSGTLAQAIFELNAEEDTQRQFILVQVNEPLSGGFKSICEIGEERIRRAGNKIVEAIHTENKQLKPGEEPKSLPDIGFRVLKIDSSNFRDTYLTPDQTDQASLLDAIDNVKDGRTPEDILFQVLPAFRIPYSEHIETLEICGKKVFDVNYGQLLACFDVDVTNEVIEEMARREPTYAVMRDLSFKDDSAATNFEELFKTFSPDTIRRVI
ncbi:site-specific DNA-methyltransferase [Anaerotardibacter muris]|uniref:site-specific DNA-methyltransferase n=1 Tax=Anaerotardibacter muris TaxID=2941505 RepID=UPI002040BD6A|nr:site-specific DNA-methyltransferase [Anaerotardibacter muris]